MLEIEIVDSNIIEGGIEVFARAWRDGVQIGFGVDGTVDLERFRVFNPPILVPDKNGDILVEEYNSIDDVTRSLRFREDPEEALLQVLEHNISVVKNSDDTNIIPGRRGNTTSTFYPDANPETSSFDGRCYIQNGSSWDEMHDRATSQGALDNESFQNIQNRPTDRLYRAFTLFDTSDIDTDTISSATLSLYMTAKNIANNDGNDFLSIVGGSTASNTGASAGDYDTCGDAIDNPTEMHDSGDRVDLSGVSTNAYSDWDFNATGIAEIDKSGTSVFGQRMGWDVVDTAPAGNNEVTWAGAETTGTTSDPKLVVVHSATTATNEVKSIAGVSNVA